VVKNYGYDEHGQLTSDNGTGYSYDLNGNRTNPGYVPGPGNRLASDGVWNYSYDNEGNIAGKENIADGSTWVYAYDHKNHLIRAEHRSVDAQQNLVLDLAADYAYDAFGNRIAKAVDSDGDGPLNSEVLRFALDGWNSAKATPIGNENWDVWADLDATGSLTTRYLRGDIVDEVFARAEAGFEYWYLNDSQGSMREVVDASGLVKDAIDYDAFGAILSESAPQFRGRYAWTGRELDAETGLYYLRGRFYSFDIGRFTSQDPLGFAAGDANLYRYVENRPTAATDPSGLSSLIIENSTTRGRRHLYYQPSNWASRTIYGVGTLGLGFLAGDGRDPAVLIGTLNDATGLVNRGDYYVPFETVQDAATGRFGGMPDWPEWFRQHDVVAHAFAQENVERDAPNMRSMADWPRASGARNAAEAWGEAHRLVGRDLPRHVATSSLWHFGPTAAAVLLQAGYRLIRHGGRTLLASRVAGRIVVHSEQESVRILRSLNGGRLIPGAARRGVVGGDSQALARNLAREMGLAQSAIRGTHAAHHILPVGVGDHRVLRRIGMELDHAANGIFLPTRTRTPRGAPQSALPTHTSNHRGYSDALRERLDALDVSRSVVDLESDVYRLQQAARHLIQQGTPLIPREGGTAELWRRLFAEALD